MDSSLILKLWKGIEDMALIRRYHRLTKDYFLLKQIAVRWGYTPHEGDVDAYPILIPREWESLAEWVLIEGIGLVYKKGIPEGGVTKTVSYYELVSDKGGSFKTWH